MAESPVGSPDAPSGGQNPTGAPSSATAATFKVNDKTLKDLGDTWARLVTHLKDFNKELSKVGQNSKGLDDLQKKVGGGTPGNTGQHPASPSGRMEGMPASPHATGGPPSDGGGGQQQLAGGSRPGIPTSVKAGLGVVGAAGAFYQSRMTDISDSDLFFNQQAQATAGKGGYNAPGAPDKNSARQAIFNKTTGIGGYQSTQDALGGSQTVLGAIGGTTAPGSMGMRALQETANMSALNPDMGFQGAGNAFANIKSSQVSMAAQSMGLGATRGPQGGQSQSQLFQSIIDKSSSGKGLDAQAITEGLAPGAPLQATLAGLGLGPDATAQFKQYGVAQANLGGDQKKTEQAIEAANNKQSGKTISKEDQTLLDKSGLSDSIRANQNKVGSAGARSTIEAGKQGESALEGGFTALANVTQSLTDKFAALNSATGGASGAIGGLSGSLGSPVGSAVKGLGGVMGASFALQSLKGHGGGHAGGAAGRGGAAGALGGRGGRALGMLAAVDAQPVWVVNMPGGGFGGVGGAGGPMGMGGAAGGRGGVPMGGPGGYAAGGAAGGRGGGGGGPIPMGGPGGYAARGAGTPPGTPPGTPDGNPARGNSRLSRAGQFAKNNAGRAGMGVATGVAVNSMTSGMGTNDDGTANVSGAAASTAMTTGAMALGMGLAPQVALPIVGAATLYSTMKARNQTGADGGPLTGDEKRTTARDVTSISGWINPHSGQGEQKGQTGTRGNLADLANLLPGVHIKYTGEDEKKQAKLDEFVKLITQWNSRGLNGIPEAKKYYDEKVAPFDKKKTRDDDANSQAGIDAINVGLKRFSAQADKNKLSAPAAGPQAVGAPPVPVNGNTGPMAGNNITPGPIANNTAPHFAAGGEAPSGRVVPGNHPHDNEMIHATPGEVVVPKPTVTRHGGPDAFMKKIGFQGRSSSREHFVDGGSVGNADGSTTKPATADPGKPPADANKGGPNIQAGVDFAKGETGKPYQYGGTGNPSWDCSGFAGAWLAAMTGKPTHQRYFTTTSFSGNPGQFGFAPGLGGRVEMGVMELNGGETSHMAGTIDGVNVESGGTNGVNYGGKAIGAADKYFPLKFHMTGAGGAPNATGGNAPASQAATGSAGPVGGNGAGGAGGGGGGGGGGGIGANEQTALASYIQSPTLSGGGAGAPTPAGVTAAGGPAVARGNAPPPGGAGAPGATAGAAPGATPDPGGSGVERWRGLVDSTLAELHLDQKLDNKVLAQIKTESSGNPNAIQGAIGDVNNASGDLAKGLMQVIGTTFRAYAGPYVSLGQLDPHASIYAGINYDSHKHGGNPTLDDLGQGHGYEQGSWELPSNETARVHRGEMVVPKGPATVIRNAIRDRRSKSLENPMPGAATTTVAKNGVSVKIDIAHVSLSGPATTTDVDNLVKAVTMRMENDKVLGALSRGGTA